MKEQFFACKYTRTLYRTCAAFEMGLDAVALCCLVVNTEDSIRYQRPVDFWNTQIQEYLGFKKWDRLDRARSAAVKAGWLKYTNGGKRRAGTYETCVPEHAMPLFGQLNGELLSPSEGYKEGYNEGYKQGYNEGVKQGYKQGELPTLSQGPKPEAETLEAPQPHSVFFKSKSCHIGNDEHWWFKGCYEKFTKNFLNECIKQCKRERKSKDMPPRPCMSDLQVKIEELAPKYEPSSVFKESS